MEVEGAEYLLLAGLDGVEYLLLVGGDGVEYLLLVGVDGVEYLLLVEVGGCNGFLSFLLAESLIMLDICDTEFDISELLDNALLVKPLENPAPSRDSSVLSKAIILPANSCLTLLSSTDKDGVDRNLM